MYNKPKWTANIVKRMWENNIKRKDIAAEMGCSVQYIGKLFNGQKTPQDAEDRIANALSAIIERRKLED